MVTSGTVQAVERALQLLELLAREPEGFRLSDLAREAGLATSTSHRLLTTLEQRGFVQFDQISSRWHVGHRAFTVGIAYSRWQSFIAAAMPFLRNLRDETRETANLGVIQEGEVVTVAQSESREIIRAIAPPGGRTPILNSGMGKAIIATWPAAAVEDLIRRHGFRRMTARSLQSDAAVFRALEVIRSEGYACDDEEFTPGLRCVAAVVWLPGREAAGAVSVSALASRLPRRQVPALGERVKAAAEQISDILAGQRPGPG